MFFICFHLDLQDFAKLQWQAISQKQRADILKLFASFSVSLRCLLQVLMNTLLSEKSNKYNYFIKVLRLECRWKRGK